MDKEKIANKKNTTVKIVKTIYKGTKATLKVTWKIISVLIGQKNAQKFEDSFTSIKKSMGFK